MKLVFEDKDGAYLGVCSEFLPAFILREKNPNFEVYDSVDGNNRFVAVKSSRLPDDQDIRNGKYGIDFNRAKPELKQALQYGTELPSGYKWIHGVAFAAADMAEYEKKSQVWDSFYSYIWDTKPQTIWVAPHSGCVNRAPDNILRFPKLWTDSNTAGVAALCAHTDRSKSSKRLMISIHSTGHLGAVLNLGDFGVLNQEKIDAVAVKMELKYREKSQILAQDFKRDFCGKTVEILDYINEKRGTLLPDKLEAVSYDDSLTVKYYEKGLRLYKQEVEEYTIDGFKRALDNLAEIQVPVITNNYFYSGRNTGKQLKLSEKIKDGLLDSAIIIECSKLYTAKDPELVSDIILDVKNELF
jgi:hypothetical protein